MQRVAVLLVCIVFIGGSSRAAGQSTQPTTEPASQPATQPEQRDDRPVRDSKADALVARVMKRLGGEEAWTATRYIVWNFFGRRTHTWDKHAMVDRIEYTDRDGREHVLIIDLDAMTGQAWIEGNAVHDEEQLAKLMTDAHSMWVNDSYWLVMPYKLRDPGVRLRHAGQRDLDGQMAEVLELTFEDDAGLTPANKYLVFVDEASDLVVQWEYYERATDRAPTLSTVWGDWKPYGEIWLSGDRGELRGRPIRITDIAVAQDMPTWKFTSRTAPQ